MVTSVEQMIEQYVSAWNEKSEDAYRREFGKCWAPDSSYTDPYTEVNGLEGLVGFARTSLEIMPSRKFSILENPEYHHHVGRYAWSVEIPGATNVGYDYFEFNKQFQITRLVSFFKLPDNYPIERLGQ